MTNSKKFKRGRPTRDLTGDAHSRILDAAQQVFLEKGFQSASIDEIVERAPASKPTVYAHFSGKEALFEAVVARSIDGLSNFEDFMAEGRTVEEKLTNLGAEIVQRFVADMGDLTRATIAEARRFPALSRNVNDAARRRRGFSPFDRGDAEARALANGTFQPKTKLCDFAGVHRSCSATDAHEISDGRGTEGY
jgi:AcrR family transcriptional regulator